MSKPRAVGRALLVGALLGSTELACEQYERLFWYENEGAVCLSTSADQLLARVALDECLSASCDTRRMAECRLSLEGDTLRVESLLRYRSSGNDCTNDCGWLTADCSMPLPPIGTYRVEHGDHVGTLTLPLSAGTGLSLFAERRSPNCQF
jgi:hypothetical protein